MTVRHAEPSHERLLASSEEAGTAPQDRRFRPDVEGLRAVAILLVVFYHANLLRLTGGYIGVDVFFVISGFVITGVLLRERSGTGRTSILDFYARRCRRILPAATLVILVSVLATYVALGVVSGTATADDGRWAAAFLANFHFESVGTNYLFANRPPSPLQNYWSLSVEEQFYLVYPTVFLVVASAKRFFTLRIRLVIALSTVIAVSYWLSVTQTASSPSVAYFSPLTRAWELALGALVAVATTWLRRLGRPLAGLCSWVGLGAIVASAFAFNGQTAYPGSLVAIPVAGAALLIAGGAAAPRAGAEVVLGTGPFQWIGRRSYSLYLWHWPLLIIAAERVGKTSLPAGESVALVLVAIALSAVSYSLVENPIRHWRYPPRRIVVAGLTLVLATVLLLTLWMGSVAPPVSIPSVTPAANTDAVLSKVAAAPGIKAVPSAVARARFGDGYPSWSTFESRQCQAGYGAAKEHICVLGDPNGRRLMLVYGDSRALMWIPALERIAANSHWRLVVLGKYACPATLVTVADSPDFGEGGSGPGLRCDAWHNWATQKIDQLKPNLLIFSSDDHYSPTAGNAQARFSATQWGEGLDLLFHSFHVPGMRMALLGSIPGLQQISTECLPRHQADVSQCSTPVRSAAPALGPSEEATATANNVQYVNTIPWFCSNVCTPIVGSYAVYDSGGAHVSSAYAEYIQNALAQSLGFPISSANK